MKETDLCIKYGLDSLQNRRDVQMACTMYRLSKMDRYVDHTMYRENLRSENKVTFLCPFTRMGNIRKSHSMEGWFSGIASNCNTTGLKTKKDFNIY